MAVVKEALFNNFQIEPRPILDSILELHVRYGCKYMYYTF